MIDNCILKSFQLFFNDFNVKFEYDIKNILKFVKKLDSETLILALNQRYLSGEHAKLYCLFV